MADAIYLPGTEMEVFEKYPLSRRLDHPTFSDVKKTTYAKGVITEFQEISDDPLVVESMVKVKIDEEESNFIPICYQPKEGYWDGEGDDEDVALARDFDEEKGCFKQAWLSFQSGDEVVVMLKEGVPVAVMGFADGVPRIGENAIKIAWEKYTGQEHFAYFKGATLKESYGSGSGGSALGPIDTDPVGADGLDLGLLMEAYKLCETAEEPHLYSNPTGMGNPWVDQTSYYKYHEYLIRLGGKAIILQIVSSYSYVEYFKASYPEGGPVKSDEPWGEPFLPHWEYGGFSWAFLAATDTKEIIERAKALGESHSGYSAYLIQSGAFSGGENGIYLPYDGFEPDSVLNDAFGWSRFYATGPNALAPMSWSGMEVTDASTIKIFTRPHTKEEMQEAGLWPKDSKE